MAALTISLPDSIPADEARLLLAIKLYQSGRLSCGQAAELAELSKRAFMETLSRHDAYAIDHPPGDLAEDMKNARPRTDGHE